MEGWIFWCNFTKAFDSVGWSLIKDALQWFGFGDGFIAVISTIFMDIKTYIVNNGLTSRYFHPFRGIRQGCCI